ncbi:flagellar hook-length control protein FliK [Roseisalinus antarcticus]|uniref:Flagellar hook-length control protein FliK n=1 Tax=Roseisalinus antarcticus TaxID=254357 RepID=A0A1Y5TFT0_9RHOB|nr:flagellar hook-length control protein FliK [Roseisalinus antarcticus]SLN63220.1 Flagellar hook-length control protein FliK [Roseisalinus antarcticus]
MPRQTSGEGRWNTGPAAVTQQRLPGGAIQPAGPLVSGQAQPFGQPADQGRFEPDTDIQNLGFGSTAPVETARHAPHAQMPATQSASTHGPAVVRQVVTGLQASGQGTTEITLDPQELGRVTLNLTTDDDGISVSVIAERPETADLIRRHIDLLSQELRQIGYGKVAYDFGGSAGRQNDQQPAAGQPTLAALAETGVEHIETGENSGRRGGLTSAGGLDLRL